MSEYTWPEGVVARFLTVGGASVDVLGYCRGVVKAVCTGERCPWKEQLTVEAYYDDTAEQKAAKADAQLPELQAAAQAHAEKCRAMPKAGGR